MGILDKIKKKDTAKSTDAKTDAALALVPKDDTTVSEKPPAKPIEFKRAESRKFSGVSEYRILRKPIITEKAIIGGTYVFEVALRANKIDIKKAFFNLYGIMPTAVRTVILEGKPVHSGKIFGRRKDWKKAIITLKKGDKIDTF